MSRKHASLTRRLAGSAPYNTKSRVSPLLSVVLVIVGVVLLICYFRSGSGSSRTEAVSKVEGDFSCTLEVQRAIPTLKKVYGDNMRKVLHVGPDTCSVVSKLLREEETESWGVEPYDIEDANGSCKTLIRKGIVREANIKFPLPYRAKSFSLVIVSDALDYLSPKYQNKTLPDLARVSAGGLVIFTAKMRSSTWWMHFFAQISLEVNEVATMKFEQAAIQMSYKPSCQVFHLNSYH